MRIILRWIINALVLVGIAYYLPGIRMESFVAALIAALVLGLINAIVKPILIILTLPVNILTLGLFTFVINALMFWLTSSLVKGFVVADFASAFWGALLLTIVSWLLNSLFKDRD